MDRRLGAGFEVRGAEHYPVRRVSRDPVGKEGGQVLVGDGDGEAGVEAREGAGLRAEGGELVDLLVGYEDGGAVACVAGDDHAWVLELGVV